MTSRTETTPQQEARGVNAARLNAAIQEGLDDIEAGRFVDIEWDNLESWLAGLGRGTSAE